MSSPTTTEERIVLEVSELDLATIIVALAAFAGTRREHPTRRTEHADELSRRLIRGDGVRPPLHRLPPRP